MAESFSEAAKAFRAGASVILPSGGKVLINISTDNAEVVSQAIDRICQTVTTLGAMYLGYRSVRFLIETAVNRGLGGERDDQEVRDIKPGSLRVQLHCFTDKRFLEVLADYESGKMKERLQEEFSLVGIKVKGMRVQIENVAEVNRTKEAIKKRWDRCRQKCSVFCKSVSCHLKSMSTHISFISNQPKHIYTHCQNPSQFTRLELVSICNKNITIWCKVLLLTIIQK